MPRSIWGWVGPWLRRKGGPMTHSLHRTGSKESLGRDFVFIVRGAKGFNLDGEGVGEKMRVVGEILSHTGPSNMGSPDLGTNIASGTTVDQMIDSSPSAKGLYCVFSSRDKARKALKELKDADLGISVTISGLIDDVFAMGRELGIVPHTVNLSLGVYGRTDLLPNQEVLDLTTMCGHGMVPAGLATKYLEEVRAGKIPAKECSRRMGAACICGIFNLDRAEEILTGKDQ